MQGYGRRLRTCVVLMFAALWLLTAPVRLAHGDGDASSPAADFDPADVDHRASYYREARLAARSVLERALGLPLEFKLYSPSGRPFTVAHDGKPVTELF